MRIVKTNVLLRFLSLLLLTAASANVFAQGVLTKRPNVAIGPNSNGYLEYLPIGYQTGSQKYPLIVYINGLNSNGDGSLTALDNEFTGGGYPHEQQVLNPTQTLSPGHGPYPWSNTWPDAYSVNGQTFRFIVITPQFILPLDTHIPTPDEIDAVISYAVSHYRVDLSRIYLMGSSQGGGAVWDYAGSSSAHANRLAAIVPFSGVSYPVQEKANIIKYAHVAVWAFHNLQDNLVPVSFTQDYINMINQPPLPLKQAKGTFPNQAGHISWTSPLTRAYTEGGLNVYQWMLQFAQTVTTANAGEDQEIALPANSVTLNGGGTGPNGTASSYNWTKVSGPPAGVISNPNIANPMLTNLAEGTYIFRLTVTDNASGTAQDDVAITVNPGAQRIQAENFTAMSGVETRGITVDGGGQDVEFIDNGDWMEYSVTVPTAATYTVRFRLASFLSGAQLQVRSSTGTLLTTVNVYNTGAWDNFMTQTSTMPLAAGTQTIRITSTASSGWNFNWFEIVDLPTASGPLPVNFTLFNAACNDGKVNLTWKTAGELNSRNFSVEKSGNGNVWAAIASIPAVGQSSVEQSYSYEDNAAGTGGLYRIVEYDQDGRRTLSSVIRANCNGKQGFSVYPNPVSDKAIVNISLEKNTKLSLSLVDSKGAVVRRQENLLPGGTNQLTIDMSGLANGVYTLLASWNNETKTTKLIKK
jgi:predicted esterase